MLTPHLRFLLATMGGWVNRSQQDVVEYLRTENRVLREQLGGPRLRLSGAQRRPLGMAAKRAGPKSLFGIGTIVRDARHAGPTGVRSRLRTLSASRC